LTRPAIVTENLTRDYGSVRALDHLNLQVPAGSIFGLLGPNGAGKTTVIRLLLGLIEPTEGRALVLGFNAHQHADEIRRRTGALLEHSGLYERLSALDNLDYFGRIWRMPDEARRVRIEQLLRHFGLWDRRLEVVGTWGRGMQQKLAVARALLHQPPLIFLDEPTGGLDAVAAAALRRELAELSRCEGVTIFLTTHNLAEAEQLCDEVAVVRDGKLLATGKPSELQSRRRAPSLEIQGRGFSEVVLALLRKRPEVAAARTHNGHLLLELRGDADTAPLVSLLVESGAEIEEVKKRSNSLEAAFLALMETP
jgi:ABC-2 type transport system ATP-binding protein